MVQVVYYFSMDLYSYKDLRSFLGFLDVDI